MWAVSEAREKKGERRIITSLYMGQGILDLDQLVFSYDWGSRLDRADRKTHDPSIQSSLPNSERSVQISKHALRIYRNQNWLCSLHTLPLNRVTSVIK